MNKDYELIDSGGGKKLERFGDLVLDRPDPQAIWGSAFGEEKWAEANAVFETGKKWKLKGEISKEWILELEGLKFKLNFSSFKHVGVFPEHISNWQWIEKQLTSNKLTVNCKILNLFGYTGGATLAAAKAGAEVTHVDSSKQSVERAKENAELSLLKDAPIRWIVDDSMAFLKREIKRGNKYDGIILDPPSFGRGLKGEVWKIEEHLMPLLDLCKQVLSDNPKFILLNGYAEGYSKYSYAQILSSVFDIPLDKIESGELTIKESSDRGFVLPAGIYARIVF